MTKEDLVMDAMRWQAIAMKSEAENKLLRKKIEKLTDAAFYGSQEVSKNFVLIYQQGYMKGKDSK